MLTKIDLCSMALLKLGESPIQSLTDDSAPAKLSRTLFDTIVDSLLALHPWSFAKQQIDLTKNTDDNFLIPSNVLRVLKSQGSIIGDKILSTSDKISIVAIVKTAPEKFPSYFAELVATRLAMEFCMPLQGNQTAFRTLVALYESELQNAKFIDSTMSGCECISDFPLVNVRF